MKVGIPREVKNHEYRVAITPSGVRELVSHGHEVYVEKDAGVGSQLADVHPPMRDRLGGVHDHERARGVGAVDQLMQGGGLFAGHAADFFDRLDVVRMAGVREQSLEVNGGRTGESEGQRRAIGIVRIDADAVVAAVDLEEDVENDSLRGVKLFYRA